MGPDSCAYPARVRFLRDVHTLLHHRYFRRLFAVRLTSQLTDGIFQVALASYMLFSPERQPNAAAIAAGFAALLLPFSVLGPFCGVLIDRWSRRQVLAWSNAARAVLLLPLIGLVAADQSGPVFFCLVVACLSVNRFLLAALAAALPHVVPRDRLVTANAVSPTCGTLAYLIGLAAGWAVSAVGTEVAVIAVASAGYLVSSLLPLRMPRTLLGPDLDTAKRAVREAVRHVLRGLTDGARHVVDRRPAALGLAAIGAHRFWYGISTVATILLCRNYFASRPDEALGLMAAVVLMSGAGFATAAFVTPVVVRRISKQRWIVWLLVTAAVVQIVPAGLYVFPGLLAAAFVFGVTAQGIKICVDTLDQENVDDVYRGRVFSFYDVLFNVVFVAAAGFAAIALPADGKSYVLTALCAAGYAIAAIAYSRSSPTRAAQTQAQPLPLPTPAARPTSEAVRP
jgi:MFS family permease